MWNELSDEDKQEYKRLILAFASLTNMFAQKSEDDDFLSPIVNSKYQETVFQKTLHAIAEDIGNTSYDASIRLTKADGNELKYLIGIKTFGIASGDQKVAQFKNNHNEWASIVDEIERNAHDGSQIRTKEEINKLNYNLYLQLAKKISRIRNERISSSQEQLRGFKIQTEDELHSVYHVLMPSKKGDTPKIFVGETDYSKIDIDNLTIIGCTKPSNPTNFIFHDKKHVYKYTSADSQLYMKFNNKEIVLEEWNVSYAEDAYTIFSEIADKIYGNSHQQCLEQNIVESYSWSLVNRDGQVELFSGYNSFYGVGSKLSKDIRRKKIEEFYEKFYNKTDTEILITIKMGLTDFLLNPAYNSDDRKAKVELRNKLVNLANTTANHQIKLDLIKLIYRPLNEMYIPIPNSKKFHKEHPNFFGKNIAEFLIDPVTGQETSKLLLDAKDRKFNLIFEPSGDVISSFITQDNGKAIESYEKQSYLGEWILKGVFQLADYEPLTKKKLDEIGINGIRLFKYVNSNDIHLQFIWIDNDNLPKDYFE